MVPVGQSQTRCCRSISKKFALLPLGELANCQLPSGNSSWTSDKYEVLCFTNFIRMQHQERSMLSTIALFITGNPHTCPCCRCYNESSAQSNLATKIAALRDSECTLWVGTLGKHYLAHAGDECKKLAGGIRYNGSACDSLKSVLFRGRSGALTRRVKVMDD